MYNILYGIALKRVFSTSPKAYIHKIPLIGQHKSLSVNANQTIAQTLPI